jgi:hypothetical protein
VRTLHEKKRRDLLVDAMVEYVVSTPGKWTDWESRNMPMSRTNTGPTAGYPQGMSFPNFDSDAQKTFRGFLRRKYDSISALNTAEETLRKESKHERSATLAAHEETFPHLEKWLSIEDDIATKVKAHLKVVRQVKSPKLASEIEVTLMECGDP